MQEYIHRIPSHYVNEDKGCAQIMLPYQSTLTLFNKNGILFNQNKNQFEFINDYLTNMKRFAFPYHNIPNHIKRTGFLKTGKTNITNQLLNFDEHYITITDGRAIERCVLFDQGQALMLTKILPRNMEEDNNQKNVKKILSRDELDELFKPKNENEKTYIATTTGDIFNGETVSYNSEDEFAEAKRKRIQDQFNRLKHNFSNEAIEFFEEKINQISIDDLKDMILEPAVYLIRMNGSNITIELIITKIISSDHYEVIVKNIPLNKYVLEQFKYMAPNIVELKEPKISPRLNPGITKQDINEAKKMILKSKKTTRN